MAEEVPMRKEDAGREAVPNSNENRRLAEILREFRAGFQIGMGLRLMVVMAPPRPALL